MTKIRSDEGVVGDLEEAWRFRRGMAVAIVSTLVNAITPLLTKFSLISLSPAVAGLCTSVLGCLLAMLARARLDPARRGPLRPLIAPSMINSVGMVCLMYSLSVLSPVLLGLLGRLYVVFAVVLSVWILKESVKRAEVVWTVVALVGGFVFMSRELSSVGSMLGVVAAIGYTLAFALSNTLIRHVRGGAHFSEILITNYGVSTIVFAVMCGLEAASGREIAIPVGGLLWAIASTVLTFIALAGLYISVDLLSFRLSNIIRSSSPVVAVLVSWPFFPVALSWLNVAGGVALLVSVAFIAALHQPGKQVVPETIPE